MNLLKFGETIINADRICTIEPLPHPRISEEGQPDPPAVGVSILFAGGATVEIRDPKAMDAFAAWASKGGPGITTLL